MIPRNIERIMEDIARLTSEAVENYMFDESDLYRHLGYLARHAMAAGRVDEIERIQKNTLDADSDVWSQDDEGKLVSLTDRYNALT